MLPTAAHFAEHCLGVVLYGAKAIVATGGAVEGERAWQLGHLPDDLHELVISALEQRGVGR